MNNKIYLTEETKALETLENKYNYISKCFDKKEDLNNICLKKTIDIAKMKKKNISSKNLEILLKEYRNYAIKIIE